MALRAKPVEAGGDDSPVGVTRGVLRPGIRLRGAEDPHYETCFVNAVLPPRDDLVPARWRYRPGLALVLAGRSGIDGYREAAVC